MHFKEEILLVHGTLRRYQGHGHESVQCSRELLLALAVANLQGSISSRLLYEISRKIADSLLYIPYAGKVTGPCKFLNACFGCSLAGFLIAYLSRASIEKD
jgi:hypothetical protein